MVYTAVTFIDGDPLPAAPLNDISTELASLSATANAEWTNYTPAWTSTGTAPAIGNGTLAGRYIVPVANLVVAEVRWIAGSTTTFGTGSWIFSLPVTSTAAGVDFGVGSAYMLDSGVGDRSATSRLFTTTTVVLTTPSGTVTPTVPWTWANGDQIRITITYEPA